MKQGTTFSMPIKIDIDFSIVRKIRFVFVQGCTKKEWVYPSDKATLEGDVIVLTWKECDTWFFKSKEPVEMDTKIYLNGTDENPETKIVTIKLNRTLFEREEVSHD